MVGFNIMFVFSVYLCLSKVLECDSLRRSRCPIMQLDNGRVRVQSSGRSARITCLTPFRLVRGNQITACVQGQWDTETPICGRTGCEIVDDIPHGKLDILNQGAKLEVKCDVGYIIDGPSFVYCNEHLEWNEELKGCKEHDELYLSCDFESWYNRLCGWKNDDFNDIDWFFDKMSISGLFSNYRHVDSGSSEYFRSNYISLSAGTYNPSTSGRLISPPLPPAASDKQKCLIFSYKVTSGIPDSISELKVSFGGIPHWETQEGEGRAIIGLYQLNVTSEIVIEGKNCKVAIDNIFVTEGNSCNGRPYEEEIDSCHDNCGKITVGRCSCDWECHNNNNCCSDIQMKCPFIKPMKDIAKLYLSTSTTAAPTVMTTTAKGETLYVTVPNVTDSYPIIITPKNGKNDTITIDRVTTVESSNVTSSTLAPVSVTNSTTMTESIQLNTTTTEVPKTRLDINSTTPLSINDYTVTTSLIPKSSKIILVKDNQSNSSKAISTPDMTTLPNTTNPTIDRFISNTTLSTEKLNTTPKAIPKTLIGKTVSTTTTFVNVSSSTFRPDKVNLTIPFIYIPRVIITKPLSTSTAVYFYTSTINSTLQYSIKLINSSSTTTKLFTPTPPNNSTKLSNKPSIPNNAPYTTTLPNITSSTIKPLIINMTSSIEKLNITPTAITKSSTENTVSTTTTFANISSSVEQSSNESLNTQYTEQKLNENKPTLNHSTTRIPNSVEYFNVSTVDKDKMVVIDTSSPNLNLKPTEYNATINNINILNAPTRQSIKIEFTNNMTTTGHENLELKNSPHNHSVQNGNLSSDSEKKTAENGKFGIGTIIIFIASVGAVLVTIKFAFSRMRLRSNKPRNDEISKPFFGTDNESYCDIELQSNKK